MSHGPFVPVLAGYIVWQRRHSLMSLPAKPSLAGAAMMLFAVLMLCIGPPTLPTFTLLTRLSFFASLIGTILLVRGMPTLRRLAYPLILLMLMLPVPSFLYDRITLPLQLVASVLAEHSLDLAGFSVLREGNILNLPGQVLSVAEACSGLRSLLSLTFLGQAYIYLMDHRPWMRWVIAVAVVPIAIISNSGRILLTAWLGSINRAWTEGVVHEWTGWAVFIIAFIALLITHRGINAVTRLLRERVRRA
jgi:exosortase